MGFKLLCLPHFRLSQAVKWACARPAVAPISRVINMDFICRPRLRGALQWCILGYSWERTLGKMMYTQNRCSEHPKLAQHNKDAGRLLQGPDLTRIPAPNPADVTALGPAALPCHPRFGFCFVAL